MRPLPYSEMLARFQERDPEFVSSQWQRAGFDYSLIRQVTGIIAEGMDYPVDRILPGDLLFDVMNDETYDFSVFEISERLESIDLSFQFIKWNDKKWLSASVKELIPETGYRCS